MAQTPEGKIKATVKKVLADSKRWGYMYTRWPVPAGFGSTQLDCVGTYFGRSFAIETKAPGKKPTPRQELEIEELRRAGAAVFVVDSHDTSEVENWLESVRYDVTGTPGTDSAGGSAHP